MSTFRIKICGLTRVNDALAAAAAGADAIGLNFSSRSKRGIPADQAAQICSAVKAQSPTVCCVGVFVEHPPEQIDRIAQTVGLDLIQLHGDHPVETLARAWSRPVLWVLRVPASSPAELAQTCASAAQAAIQAAAQVAGRTADAPLTTSGVGWQAGLPGDSPAGLAGILVDAYSPAGYGGTGETIDWEPFGRRYAWRELGWSAMDWPRDLPLVLAGGLHPANVATAIAQAAPTAVDVASGVETAPGIKCPQKMAAFIAAARAGWDRLPNRSVGVLR
jgi:phosphoribosylanthranilate isomerase